MRCDKCLTECDHPAIVTEWGECYSFCKLCSIAYEEIGTTGCVKEFINGITMPKWVLRHMIDAKKRRADGNSPWN